MDIAYHLRYYVPVSSWIRSVPSIPEMVGYRYPEFHVMKSTQNAAHCVSSYAQANGYTRDELMRADVRDQFDVDVRELAVRSMPLWSPTNGLGPSGPPWHG